MHISSKGEYGLRALLDLAQYDHKGPVQSRDISARQGIDENYLNQIMITLRKAGLIESIRGPQGGHHLARDARQITLLEAVQALEGPLLPNEPGRDKQSSPGAVDREIVQDVLGEMRTVLEGYLASITLDDLVQRKRKITGEIMYYI